jgi:hypothetical protein
MGISELRRLAADIKQDMDELNRVRPNWTPENRRRYTALRLFHERIMKVVQKRELRG